MTAASYRGLQVVTALDSEAGSRMHEAPLQVILGVFASPTRAGEVRLKLRENERLELIEIVSLALIKRDDDGRLEFLESRSAWGGIERRAGSLSGILRLVWGPSSSSRLHELATALPPGSSAIAALIEHRWVDDVRALMEEAGADTVADVLKSEIAAALSEGRDVVLTAGAADWRTAGLERLRIEEVLE